ncbi:MAG: hypothetical protein RR296_11770 [Clostridia bacterium]
MEGGMESPWIERKARMPTKEDADIWGCVLIWDVNNGVMVCGWNNKMSLCRGTVTHWMTPPQKPTMEE